MESKPESLRRILARCIENMPQSFGPVYFSLPVPDNLKWKTGLKLCGVCWHVAFKMCRKVLGPFTLVSSSPTISKRPETLRNVLERYTENVPQSFGPVYFSLVVLAISNGKLA